MDSAEEFSQIFHSARIGCRVSFYGKCAEPESASNPGQFDSKSYYLARNIILTMNDASLLRAESPPLSVVSLRYAFRNLISDLRCGMQQGLRAVFGNEDESLISSVILGDRSGLDEETRSLFQDGGMTYLLTVSSLHISMLGMAVYRLLRRMRRPFTVSAAFSACSVIGYAILAGESVSAQRAVIMFLFWLGAQITGRTNDRLTAASASAMVILVRQPYALTDPSFLMSFGCILSLELIPPVIRSLFPTRNQTFIRLQASAGMSIGTLPLTMWFFYQVTPYAFLFHLVIFPCMSMLLVFGMLGCITGSLLNALTMHGTLPMLTAGVFCTGRLLAGPCHFLLLFFRRICMAERYLPCAVVITGRPARWQAILYYALLAMLVLVIRRTDRKMVRKHIRRFRVFSCMLAGGIILILTWRRRPDFRFTCLDVGQGSCCLIEHGSLACLFDAGSSSVTDVWKYRIDSTLKYYGIPELDMVFLSHGDMDHIDGIGQMLPLCHRNLAGQNAGDVTVREICLPDLPEDDERLTDIITMADDKGIKVSYLSEGAAISHGDLRMDVLAPSASRITGESNEDCMVMLLYWKHLKILFTADLEKEGEKMFVDAYQGDERFAKSGGSSGDQGNTGSDFTVLIAGHHGSKNATSSELLALVRPDLALISCGRNNRYGHPAPEMLSRLEGAGVPYRRTDLEGAVTIMG